MKKIIDNIRSWVHFQATVCHIFILLFLINFLFYFTRKINDIPLGTFTAQLKRKKKKNVGLDSFIEKELSKN